MPSWGANVTCATEVTRIDYKVVIHTVNDRTEKTELQIDHEDLLTQLDSISRIKPVIHRQSYKAKILHDSIYVGLA